MPKDTDANIKKRASLLGRKLDHRLAEIAADWKMSEQEDARIRRLPAQKQQQAIELLPKGIYVNLPAYWHHIEDPKELLDALYYYGEPLSTDMLNAMERLLPRTTNEAQQLEIGVLLYRYRRPMGHHYLSLLIQNDSPLCSIAALIFALNHEDKELGAILSTIQRHPEDAYPQTIALNDWQDPKISIVIKNLLLKHPEQDYLMAAAANHNISEVLPLIRSIYTSSYFGETRNIYAGLALIKFKHADTSHLINDFSHRIMDPHTETDARDSRYMFNLLQAVDDSRVTQLAPAVLAYIYSYIHSSIKSSPKPNNIPIAYTAGMAGMVLYRLRGIEAGSTLTELLKKIASDTPGNPIDNRQREISRVLISINMSLSLVERIQGKKWVQDEKVLQKMKLNQIPATLLLDLPRINMTPSDPF